MRLKNVHKVFYARFFFFKKKMRVPIEKCIIIGCDANAVDNYVVFDSIQWIF